MPEKPYCITFKLQKLNQDDVLDDSTKARLARAFIKSEVYRITCEKNMSNYVSSVKLCGFE